jgi:hypothetical protein
MDETTPTNAGAAADPCIADGVRLARNAIQEFAARPEYAWNGTELLANLRAVHELEAVLEAAKLGLIAALDARPELIAEARPGKAAITYLTRALRLSRSQATRDAAAAAAIASASPELPAMGAALAAGEVSRAHLDIAVKVIDAMPRVVKNLVSEDGVTGSEVIDELLTEQALTGPPGRVDDLGRDLLNTLDPKRAERLDDDAVIRRSGTIVKDSMGMGLFRFTLDPATTALTLPVLERWSVPFAAGQGLDERGQPMLLRDQRSRGQRLADAFAAIVATVAGVDPATGRRLDDTSADETGSGETGSGETSSDHPAGSDDAHDDHDDVDGQAAMAADYEATIADDSGEGYALLPLMGTGARQVEVLVLATLDQLAAAHGADDLAARTAGLAHLSIAGTSGGWAGSSLDPATLARLSCDSPLRRALLTPDGAVLNLGRRQRLATPNQKKALAARDHGCAIPGCGAPPEYCDVHHVTPWAMGGPTNIDSMILVCSRDHTALHAGIYSVEMRDGIPWVRLPSWIDAFRPWVRNTTHQHRQKARCKAQQLRTQLGLRWQDTDEGGERWSIAG